MEENEEIIETGSQPAEAPSIRDLLTENVNAAEGTAADGGEAEAAAQRARDEAGRFTKKEEAKASAPAPTPTPAAAPAPTPADTAASAPAPATPTLTTWRKEYIPLQQKLAAGQALNADEAKKLAEYNVQREREYSTGISAYKAEVQAAKPVMDVLQEFAPALQGAGMKAEQWIQNMGRTHAALVFGTPEQKLNVLAQAMQGYGISPQAFIGFLQGTPDQEAMAAMHQAHAGSQHQYQLQQANLRAQQAEQRLAQVSDQEVNQQLAKFQDASQYPHFAQVRGAMAQLLDAGLAQDLDTAYAKAVMLDTDIQQAEQERQAAAKAEEDRKRVAAVAKARQAGGSMRSGTSGISAAPPQSNDIRQALEAAFDEHAGAGRV